MTILEALKSEVSYPIPETYFEKSLIERGLDGEDNFTQQIAVGGPFRLAYADCLKRHITAVNIGEGGMSISVQNADKLVAIANGIYSQYGEPLLQIGEPKPSVTYLGEDWYYE